MSFITPLIQRLRSLSFHIFPGLCMLCGLSAKGKRDLCQACAAALPPLGSQCKRCALPLPEDGLCGECLTQAPDFSRVICPFKYQTPVDHLVQRFKYRGDLKCGTVLAALMVDHIRQNHVAHRPPDILVPVPLHWRRLMDRGFNQAGLLATQLGGALGIPVLNRALTRRHHTPPQQQLGRTTRRQNLRLAFRANKNLGGQSVALVDDVVTSTGTARAAATALKECGAGEIQVWCLARTPLEK